MEWCLQFWASDYVVSLVGSFCQILAAGVFLAGSFWCIGYVVNHLFSVMKGGL